ncbi:unnamed protein product [Lepeophtheirus salmonis]|uniref:(salmon louse) hypothetical protein n=1 Tax=Lepeophtheirus salmonis TaxID=72036 RepID=A0A7R8D012_LEPSM|nr:unnamed protein product [Lepeophtheirus salmonis]CAF2979914.1 unnamed protein product [Lepeophtheirus salmonis]
MLKPPHCAPIKKLHIDQSEWDCEDFSSYALQSDDDDFNNPTHAKSVCTTSSPLKDRVSLLPTYELTKKRKGKRDKQQQHVVNNNKEAAGVETGTQTSAFKKGGICPSGLITIY